MNILFRTPTRSVTSRQFHFTLLLCLASLALLAASSAVRGEEKPPDSSTVALAGHVARTPVRQGEPVRFWITIENRGSSAIQHIRLERIDPGTFLPVAGSLAVPSGDVCKAPPKSGATTASPPEPHEPDQICAYLGPHQSFTIWGDVRADNPVKRQDAFAVLQWQSPDGPSVSSVLLGEVESLGCVRWIWYSLLHEWELGVPTFVAFFGGIFAIWRLLRDKKEEAQQQARDKKEQSLQQAREKANRDQRELEDFRGKTWNLMLPDSHRVALKYYMPISSSLFSVLHEFKRYHSTDCKNEDIAQSAYYYLLKFHWDVRRTARELGAYYFKNRTAESLVNYLYQDYRQLHGLKTPATQRLLDRCLDSISAEVTFDQIADKIAKHRAPIYSFWGHVSPWLKGTNCRLDLQVLQAYYAVLVYEANRPYEHWYGRLQPISLSPEAYPEAHACACKAGWANQLGKETADYLEAALKGL